MNSTEQFHQRVNEGLHTVSAEAGLGGDLHGSAASNQYSDDTLLRLLSKTEATRYQPMLNYQSQHTSPVTFKNSRAQDSRSAQKWHRRKYRGCCKDCSR